MLEDAEKTGEDSIISWLRGGEWISIHDPAKFEKEIMNKYFPFSSYKAFVREMNRYGFQQRHGNQKSHIFYHQRFIRRDKNMCLSLRRKAITHQDKGPTGRLLAAPLPSSSGEFTSSGSPQHHHLWRVTWQFCLKWHRRKQTQLITSTINFGSQRRLECWISIYSNVMLQ